MLNELPSPFLIDRTLTRIDGDAEPVRRCFIQHRAVALTQAFTPAFLNTLMALADRSEYIRDTTYDLAHREREAPGIAGGALALALRRENLLVWLQSVTQSLPLLTVDGDIMRNWPGDADRLYWHDDLSDRHGNPRRRLGVTIGMGDRAYDGGTFALRRKSSGEELARYRHVRPGSILLFEVDSYLEHRVYPLTSGGPRRVFVGWFLSEST